MVRVKFIFILIIFISLNKFCAQINFNWADQFAGGSSAAASVTQDASGNIYTVGSFSGTVDFDPGPATFTLAGSGGYICKLGPNGNFIWAKNCADGSASSYYVGLDGLGNIIISGNFNGTVDFDPGMSVFNLSSGNFFISKLDPSGNFIWAQQMSGNTYSRGMNVDVSGNIIFTGAYGGTVDFDPGPGTYTATSVNNTTIYVFKLNNTGNLIWLKEMICSQNNSGFGGGITSDNSGNIFYTGYAGPPTDMDPGPGTYTIQNCFVSKLDINGNFVWAKSFNNYAGRSITVDAAGDVYSTGNFFGTVDFDPGPGIYNLSSYGFLGDIYVSKLSNSGNFIWAQKIGGTTNDLPISISIDPSGNAYVIGTLDFNTPDPNIVISKIDASGNFAWAKQLGNVNYDGGGGIIVDASENIYATGIFNGTIDYDPSPGIYTLTSAPTSSNINNAFVLKWSKCTSTVSPPTNITNTTNQTVCSGNSATLSVSGPIQINWFDYPNSPTVIGTGSTFITPILSVGTYTFYAESNACSIGKTPITVTVNPSPTITVNSGSLCAGQSFTINPGGASTYTFSGGSNVVTPASTTSYSVTGTATNGCISLNAAVSTISVDPLPVISANNGTICPGQSFIINPTGASTYTYSNSGPFVTPTVTTSYSITGTSTTGCISSAPAITTVSVYPTPTILVNSGAICSGNSFTINPSGALTYTYSSGSNTVFPTANASFSVTGTDVNGCVNITPAISNVTVNALPSVNAVSNMSLICTGQSATLAANGANTYTWSNSSNANSIVVSPTVTTTYTVTGTDVNGCQNFAIATQSVSLCTGIVTSGEAETQVIKLYPNPTIGVFTLEVNSIENSWVEIYNSLGELILLQEINSANLNIDLKAQINGLYYVRIRTNEKNKTFKLIKE